MVVQVYSRWTYPTLCGTSVASSANGTAIAKMQPLPAIGLDRRTAPDEVGGGFLRLSRAADRLAANHSPLNSRRLPNETENERREMRALLGALALVTIGVLVIALRPVVAMRRRTSLRLHSRAKAGGEINDA